MQPASAQVDGKSVLVLSSGSSSLPAGVAALEGIVDAFRAGGSPEVAIFTEYLDALRLSGPRHKANAVRYLRERYADAKPDVVIVLGPQALDLMRNFGDEIAPSAPVVYAAVRETSLGGALPSRFTGVVSRFDPVRTVELALALQPKTKEVTIVTGAADFDRAWEARLRGELAVLEDTLNLRYLSGLTMDDLLAAVARMPPDSIILYITVVEDGAGRLFTPRDVAASLSRAASAPIYSVYDTYLGRGIVGGFMDTFESVGARAGGIARRILDGESLSGIDTGTSSPHTYIVDWHELQRWGLDESRLPAGTEVRYRSPSLWDQYWKLVLAAAAIVLLQLAFIIALLFERRHRRRVEGSLRESEERYRNVVETQSELICRYLPDTTLTFVNDAYGRYFGRTRKELIGAKWLDLLPGHARPAAMRHVRSLLARPRAETYQHEVLRPDGTLGWQQWIDRAILDAEGRVSEIQGVGRDLTELKQAEAEVRERQREVTHLTRVSVLGEISGAVAHELNQPLSAILSNAQAARRLLGRASPDLANLGEILDDIVTDDKRAGAVIQRLRALLRKGETRLLRLDFNGLVMDVLDLAHSELVERRVIVETSLAASLPAALGDRVQLQQVLLNLILNGCEAMSNLPAPDRRLSIATTGSGNGVIEAKVADRGTGIDPVLLDRIFEPFVTTTDNGLGLGLSICRSIVTAHGGRMWARNNPDRGATLGFTLPVHGGQH